MLATLLLFLWVGGGQADRFTVYLSAPMRDGFVDTSKEIQDSVKDIRGRLSKMKEFQVIDSREKADIVLTVVARGVGSEAFGQRLKYEQYYNNAVLTSVPIVANTFWVTTVMEVGQYKKEFSGSYTHKYASSMGAWGECAKQLAEDVKSWALANAAQLRQRRITVPLTPPNKGLNPTADGSATAAG